MQCNLLFTVGSSLYPVCAPMHQNTLVFFYTIRVVILPALEKAVNRFGESHLKLGNLSLLLCCCIVWLVFWNWKMQMQACCLQTNKLTGTHTLSRVTTFHCLPYRMNYTLGCVSPGEDLLLWQMLVHTTTEANSFLLWVKLVSSTISTPYLEKYLYSSN